MKRDTKILMIAISLSSLLFLLIMPLDKNSRQSCLAQGTSPQEVREVEIDIEPGFCPNPLNAESHDVMTVAILGTENQDVTGIDPKSVRLENVTPIQYMRKDVSTPVTDRQDVCDCTIEGKDGINDLVLSFNISKIVSTLGDVGDGDVAVLTISGKLLNGTPIEGEDCVIIRRSSSDDDEE